MFLFRLFLLFTTLKFAVITRTQGARRPPVSTPQRFASAKGQGRGKHQHTNAFRVERQQSAPHPPAPSPTSDRGHVGRAKGMSPSGLRGTIQGVIPGHSVPAPLLNPPSQAHWAKKSVEGVSRWISHGAHSSLPATGHQCPGPQRLPVRTPRC